MKHNPKFGKLAHKLGKGRLGASLSTVGSMRPGAIPLMIELGVSGIKVLQLTGSNPSTITAAAFMPTPDDLLDNPSKRLLFQMDALPKFLRGEKISATRAACLIPAGQMICKHTQLIPTDGVPTEQIAGAQLSAQLGCEPGALLVRCRTVPTPRATNRQEVICLAASREFVGRLMGALKTARLDPVGIHTEFDAIARAVQLRDDASGVAGSGKPTLILDLGTGTTKVLVMHGRDLVFARIIELGARHLDETIAHQLRCTMMEAREMREALGRLVPEPALVHAAHASAGSGLAGMPPAPGAPGGREDDEHEHGDGPAPQPASRSGPGFGGSRGPQIDLSEPLEIMGDEISMCLRYHDALFPGSRVERVVFVGGQARHQPLCAHLARRLKLDAQMLDPLACLARTGRVPASGVDLRSAQPGWAAIVGGALSPMDL